MGKLGSLWPYTFMIYAVDEKEDIVEQIAGANHFAVADAAFQAALLTRHRAMIQMRNGARVMKTVRTD